MSYVQPHYPSCPPARYVEAIDADAIPEPIPPEWPDDPNAPKCFSSGDPARHGHEELPGDWRRRRQYYLADVAHLDEQLGRVLDDLEAAGQLEETYIVFIADHGELLYDHGFTGKAQKHYDAGIRIPLVVAGPGLDEGATRDEFVQLEDVFPTVLDATGVDPPAPETGPFVDDPPVPHAGRSLLPLCRGESPGWREAAYVESYNNIYTTDPIHWARTIRTDTYRYTTYPGENGEQLFSVGGNASEAKNLVDDPEFAEVRHRLRNELLERVFLQDHPYPPRDRVALGMP